MCPQHVVSSVWQKQTVVLKPPHKSLLSIIPLLVLQVQQSRSTRQKNIDGEGKDVEVEGSDEEEEDEDAVEASREG